MKKTYFVFGLASLVILSFAFIMGCGSEVTSGGGGGGGGGVGGARTIYVATTGSDDAGDGSSTNPFKTIQKAMNVSVTNEVIMVNAGIYKEHITWSTRESVTLSGESADTVIISGEGTGRCIYLSNTAGIPSDQTATIENLTIRNGQIGSSYRGAGIAHLADGVMLKIRNCIFTRNGANAIHGHYGGGLGVSNSAKARIENCVFASNEAENGGAILNENTSQVYIKNCAFYSNTCETSGGAIIGSNTGYLTVDACSIFNNTAPSFGGGIYSAAKTTIINSLIYNNKVLDGLGGGIYFDSSNSSPQKVINCTVVSNEAKGISSGSGGIQGTSDTIIENTICWGNTAVGDPTTNDLYDTTTTVNYTDMKVWPANIVGGIGTTDAYPVFVNFPPAAATDLDLSDTTSPLSVREGGTNEAGVPSKDYLDHYRTVPYSMGAFESDLAP